MSTQITTAFVEQYKANVALLSQQMGSRLRNAVRVEPIVGTKTYIDQIGSTAAVVRTSRHGDTPLVNTPHSRRRIALTPYEWADLVDDADKVKLLVDPTSDYARAAAAAMGRAMDLEIIAAATGTAYTGVAGGTSTVLPSSQKIAVATSGLTFAKLTQARKILMEGEGAQNGQLYCAITAAQWLDLVGEAKFTSSDYITGAPLSSGNLPPLLGFNFIVTELLTQVSTTRTCFAWVQDGLGLGLGQDIVGRISERDDKSYSTQVYYAMQIGASRLEEVKVVQIDCYEA